MVRHEVEGTEATFLEAPEEIAAASEEVDLSVSIARHSPNKKASPKTSLRKIATRELEETATKEEDSGRLEAEVVQAMMEDSEVVTDTAETTVLEIGITLKTPAEPECSEQEEVRFS